MRAPLTVLLTASVVHEPWPLQPAEANLELNTMTDQIGITVPDSEPLLYFSAAQPTYIWPLGPA